MSKDKEIEEMKALEKDVKDLRKDLDTRLAELKDQVTEMQKKAAKAVAERPMLALGVAFVIGMAFGVALSRSKD